MAKYEPRTAPDPNLKGWPGGIKYIIGNEGCERFSFYGMKAVLQVHLTMLFMAAGIFGYVEGMTLEGVFSLFSSEFYTAIKPFQEASGDNAQEMYHLFVAGVYALPMVGALVADRLLGKYHTILSLSIVYCAGHFVLAIGGENSIGGMMLGLSLIAIGSGGIKPCVSAHVGDQFGRANWHLVDKVYQAFYFIINFGSFIATLLIPILYNSYGPGLAFGLPGVLMTLATIAFWMGRKEFVHVPSKPGGKLGLLDAACSSFLFLGFIGLPMFFVEILGGWPMTFAAMGASVAIGLALFFKRQSIQEDDGFIAVTLSRVTGKLSKFSAEAIEGSTAVVKIFSVFIMVSVFWALFDQHGSSWIRQGMMMDLSVDFGIWAGELLPSQIQSLNPAMVMLLIPFNMFVVYPLMGKVMKATPLRKMTIGMFIASLSFVAVALIQGKIDGSDAKSISVAWQIIPFVLITQAEVMVSITGLEFAYSQAPARMKSTIMGFWLLTVALGNKLVAVITKLGDMPLEQFFWTFAGLMAGAATIFGLRAAFYTGKTYTQDVSPVDPEDGALVQKEV